MPNGLKRNLLAGRSENVVFMGDLVSGREQKGINVAVDMSIAEKAEIFVGNRCVAHIICCGPAHAPLVFEHVRQHSYAADGPRPASPDQ